MQKTQLRVGGSALLIIIVAMVLVAILGLAIVSLTGTRALDTVVYNNDERAWYLAESGYRYAAGLYLNTENRDTDGSADDEKAEVLQNKIDGGEYVLPGGGKFLLTAFPYWLIVNSDYTGQTKATFRFPGQIPRDFGIPQTGVMAYAHPEKTGEEVVLFHYSGASVSSTAKALSCTLGARLVAGTHCEIQAKDSLYLALPLSVSGNTTVGLTNKSLQLDLSVAKSNRCIPPYNGVFIWGTDNAKEYLYQKAEFKDNTVILHNITEMNGTPVTTGFVENIVDVEPAKKFLVFKRNLALTSRGEAGSGDLASVRIIKYNIPLSGSASEDKGELGRKEIIIDSKKKLTENFEALSGTTARFQQLNTMDSVTGQEVTQPYASIEQIRQENGEKLGHVVLRINKNWPQSGLSETQQKLRDAWKKNNHFLEYDVQLKLSSSARLLHGGGGLSFRMSPDRQEYLALSFMKFHVPSLVYRHTGHIPNTAGGTLTGYDSSGRIIFSGVRCLGNAEPNRFYYHLRKNASPGEKKEPDIGRVAIHPDDYSGIKENFSRLNGARLVLTGVNGGTHTLGTVSYPHNFQARWDYRADWPLWPGNDSRYSFGPYNWPAYNDFIPQAIKPLVDKFRMGSMSDWWTASSYDKTPMAYYNFHRDKKNRYWIAHEQVSKEVSPYNIFDRLVLVLWEQYRDADGTIKKRWLAARDMTDDDHLLGIQQNIDGRIVHDDSTLMLRLRENMIKGVKTNLINVFYGDKIGHDSGTSKPYDMVRKRNNIGETHWPPLSLGSWTAKNDYFTHIQSVVQNGQINNSFNWHVLNPAVKVGEGEDALKIFELREDGTILISHLTSPNAESNQSNTFTPDEETAWNSRPEISYHAFGDIRPGKNASVAMSGFGLRTVIGGEAGHLKGGFQGSVQR